MPTIPSSEALLALERGDSDDRCLNCIYCWKEQRVVMIRCLHGRSDDVNLCEMLFSREMT